MKIFVVSSSQLGAKEKDIANAIELMNGPAIRHYWDGEKHVGRAIRSWLPDLDQPAWDVWLLFEPGIRWDATVPEPTWWEHQLPKLDAEFPDRRLDARRFARRATEIHHRSRREP